jgi:DNA-binding GntR family transcriptional regulator
MTQPGTFDRVYAAIKTRLRDGAFRPGEKLEPAMLSDAFNASVTPVRDALHRLRGERLVEAPRHEGFRAPMLTETMLRHLYAWHLDILLLAIARHRAGHERTGEDQTGLDPPEGLGAVLAGLAAESGNPEHLAAFRNVTERLEPFQRLECEFLDATGPESVQIIAAVRAGDRRELRKRLARYHRRRARIVPELIARAQGTG